MLSVQWHLVQRGEEWAGPRLSRASLRCMYQMVPTHQRSLYQSPYVLYNGPLFCGFNEPIKGLTCRVLIELLIDDDSG